MEKRHLISVEDRLELSTCGLVVLPALSAPSTVSKQFQAQVTVERPDGQRLEAASNFDLPRYWSAPTVNRKQSDCTASASQLKKELCAIFAEIPISLVPICSKIAFESV